MEKKIFIEKIKSGAIRDCIEFNVLASLTVAQAILESAWGDSKLTRDANNLFGIKAHGTEESYRIDTGEYVDGKQVIEKNCAFRKYKSWEDSIHDHTRLLCNSRYKKVREAKNYVDACRAVMQCGYATDPNYANKLIQLIEQNNLQELDKEAACDINNLPMLRHGQRNDFVKLLQKYLNKNGDNLVMDGIFGDKTLESVKSFQRKKRLVIDGIVGIKTWTALTK